MARKGKPTAPNGLCGAKRPGKDHFCRHRAGFRTGHLGYGRCYLHGGSSPVKLGVYSRVVEEQAQHRLAVDPVLHLHGDSLQDEIAFLRLCVIQAASGVPSANVPDDGTRAHMVAEILEKVGRTVKRKWEIDKMRSIILRPEDLHKFVELLGQIMRNHIGDPEVIIAIGKDLRRNFGLNQDGKIQEDAVSL